MIGRIGRDEVILLEVDRVQRRGWAETEEDESVEEWEAWQIMGLYLPEELYANQLHVSHVVFSFPKSSLLRTCGSFDLFYIDILKKGRGAELGAEKNVTFYIKNLIFVLAKKTVMC